MSQQGTKHAGFLGSLKDALAAASRDDTQRGPTPAAAEPTTQLIKPEAPKPAAAAEPAKAEAAAAPVAVAAAAAAPAPSPSAAEAAREVKAQTSLKAPDKHVEFGAPPTTRVVRGGAPKPAPEPVETTDAPRTQLVRGKVQVKRGEFEHDPVVGWLVVVGGPGLGCYRPIFEGNNTVGRASDQRIPLDFGDDAISSEEQAYLRYDSSSRSFLFVPNLAKTNIVSINDKRPTGAVELNQMDVITIGRTQLVFVPFCGSEFDWAELTDSKD